MASPMPSWVSVLLEVVVVGVRIGRDRRLQRLGVARREGAQRVLDAVAELGQHLVGHVVGQLGDEEDADALGADEAHGLRDLVEELLRRVLEQQVGLVEEEDELGLVEVADLGQRRSNSSASSHMRKVEKSLGLSCTAASSRQLMTPSPSGVVRSRSVDRELGLAEEGVGALLLELDDRAQQHAGGRRRQAADGLELGLALVAR